MSQSKRFSLIEAITNTAAGLIVAFAVQLVIYPLMGIAVTLPENILLTSVFTAVSIIRGYFIRRLFSLKKHHKV